MRRAALLLIFLSGISYSQAQQSELFVSTQSGSPVLVSAFFAWNFSIGVEKYIEDNISIAASYRKLIGLESSDFGSERYSTNNYDIDYFEDYDAYAIDFESKYFFDEVDEGWFLSSNISFQHITQTVEVEHLTYQYTYSTPTPIPVTLGKTENTFNIFPLGIKLGHRNSGDLMVFDYYFGLMKNIGRGKVERKNEEYMQYDHLNNLSFILGIKVGFKM